MHTDSFVVVYAQSQNVLAAPVEYANPIGAWFAPKSVAIGDLNHDGRNEVIFPGINAVRVMLQKVNGTLNAPVCYPSAYQVLSDVLRTSVGDLNGDGRVDVVSIYSGTDSQDVEVYLQRTPTDC